MIPRPMRTSSSSTNCSRRRVMASVGRHWLDVIHYGESHGYDKDKPRVSAWPYRDYVIQSLNDDKPYSRFIEEQIAGDVLFPNNPQAFVATGFIAAGPGFCRPSGIARGHHR